MNQKIPNLKNKPDWKKDNEILRAISLLGQLGLVMVASILIFVLLGLWVNKTFGLGSIIIGVCSFLGILCGGIVNFRLLKRWMV